MLGALFVPASSVEIAGVLEATLFEVKRGTLLFAVNQRVYSEAGQPDASGPVTGRLGSRGSALNSKPAESQRLARMRGLAQLVLIRGP